MDTVKAENFFQKYKSWLFLAAALFIALWLSWLWYGKQQSAPETYQVAAPAKAVAGMIKEEVTGPAKIKVLPKKQASKKLDLPEDVTNDDNQQVIDTADIPVLPNGGTSVTIQNTATGDSKTLIKANPAPLFAFLRTGAVGGRFGITNTGDQQATLFVRQDVARVATVHLSATVEARTTLKSRASEGLVGVEISHRW